MGLIGFHLWRLVLVAVFCAAIATATGSPRHEAGLRGFHEETHKIPKVSKHISRRQEPLRVLVVGDSQVTLTSESPCLTHQKEGDWTWRYRLWQWFQEEKVSVQFVGPYKGTSLDTKSIEHDSPSQHKARAYWDMGVNWDGGYSFWVDPLFTNNHSYHFAAAGRPLRDAKDWIEEVLKLHPADMMLVALGINDLAFCCSAEDVIIFMQELINNARKVLPNLKVAAANVPYQSFMTSATEKITQYNGFLPGNITKWSTAQSPVHLVDLAGRYACGSCDCPAGFDGLHPNSWGEYHIAYAFSETLVRNFGVGHCPITPPAQDDGSLDRFLPPPEMLKVRKGPEGILATWNKVYGSYEYRVEITRDGGPPVVVVSLYNYWSAALEYPRSIYTVRVAAAAQNKVGNWTKMETAVGSDTTSNGGLVQRDHLPEPHMRSIRARDENTLCIGGTAPIPMSCSTWRKENLSNVSVSHFHASGTSLRYPFIFCVIFITTWLGWKILWSRGHRKRLLEWRRLGASWLPDGK